jgi:AAA family ATP:ADP antiporter
VSATPTASPDVPPKSPLERLLGLFTEVKGGEGLTVLLLALNIFLILSAYYVIKPVREALILSGDGAEVKSYASAGQALLLLGAVPLYGWLAGCHGGSSSPR